jgi:hypothetical protein
MKQSIGADRGISIRVSLGSCRLKQGCYCCHFCRKIARFKPIAATVVAFIESKKLKIPKLALEHIFLCQWSGRGVLESLLEHDSDSETQPPGFNLLAHLATLC